jgi:hypothetical protein
MTNTMFSNPEDFPFPISTAVNQSPSALERALSNLFACTHASKKDTVQLFSLHLCQ